MSSARPYSVPGKCGTHKPRNSDVRGRHWSHTETVYCDIGPSCFTGDYVVLGGNQVFRFNNPTEAAKLREHRRVSQQ